MNALLLSQTFTISLDDVLHVLNTAAQVATAGVSVLALWRSSQAKHTAEAATEKAKDAAREQFTFALRRAVKQSALVHPSAPVEETGTHD